MTDLWLRSLITFTPEKGYELAVKLTQRDVTIRENCAPFMRTTLLRLLRSQVLSQQTSQKLQ